MSRKDINLISPDIRQTLQDYAKNGVPLSGDSSQSFLEHVICNDFVNAVCKADDENFKAIAAIAVYVYNELPGLCWGSRKIYKLWLQYKRAEPGSESAANIHGQLVEAKNEAWRFFHG